MIQLSQQTRSLQDEATSTTCTPGGQEVRDQGVRQRAVNNQRSVRSDIDNYTIGGQVLTGEVLTEIFIEVNY